MAITTNEQHVPNARRVLAVLSLVQLASTNSVICPSIMFDANYEMLHFTLVEVSRIDAYEAPERPGI
jgi:hypothetical protein